MGRERLLRGGREGRDRAFDWYALAKERDISLEQARVLYEEALRRRARDAQEPYRNAEAIYLELLEEARQEAWRPSPGKVTRTMRLAAERAGKKPPRSHISPLTGQPIAPGKRTLTSYLEPPARERRPASRERERLEAIAASFRAMGVAVPPDLQSALARLQHAEPSGMAPGAESMVSDAASTAAPPVQERLESETAAHRRLQANLLAAHGHFEELEALEDEESLEAEPPRALEASQPREAARDDAGQPLPPEAQARMERVFGHSFSDVIVYPDSREATGQIRALTRGREIHFRGDVYAPGTARGDWLIAHELAHVVQQTAARGPRTERRALEAEADRAASAALAGQRAAVSLDAPLGATQAFSDAEEHDDELPESPGPDLAAEATTPAPAAAEASTGVAAGLEEPEPPEPIDLGALAQELAGAETGAAPAPAAGGGGADASAELVAEAPAVSQSPPEQGLAALTGVRPDRLAGALGGVRTAVGRDEAEAREALAEDPPREMSTGEEMAGGTDTHEAGAGEAGDAEAPAVQATVAQMPETAAAGAGEPAALEQAPGDDSVAPSATRAAPPAADAAVTPAVAGTPQGEGTEAGGMSEAEVARVSGAIDALSTSDPHAGTDPGPAPALDAAGSAAERTEANRAALDESVTGAEGVAATDISQPVGEEHIAPTLAPEELTAEFDGAAADAAAGTGAAMTQAQAAVQAAGAAALGNAETAGIIAHLEKRAEIDAALTEAQTQMAAERQAQVAAEARERARADEEIAALRAQADADQTAAREQARAQVEQARADWQAEVGAQAAAARTEAEVEVQAGMSDIEAEQTRANAEARRHIDGGRAEAEAEQARGEAEAGRIKEEKEEESGGFFGWVASQAEAFFEGVKQAISAALDAARQAIQSVIQAARDLAMAAIEAARQVIVHTIRAVGDALIAIGDRLLAAFPELRERFRETMQGLVDSAVEAVNQIAEGLKAGVQAALDLVAQGLEVALGLLERGLHAIVDGVSAVVQGAIQFAEGVVQALGTFAVLIKDIAGNPGGWLGLLGAAIMDGIQNHLWAALQTAVQGWFQNKVLELLGIGGVVLELLMDGGIDLGQITQMAWEGLQSAIPAALIAILIEKLVSMIVPAAGAVMAVIEGLQAAWGAVSRIIAAMNAFVAFLRAVKGGAAGPLFANLLALSTVVVIDFVSNWLLRKLMRAARRVGSRLRQTAERFRRRRRRRDRRRDRSQRHRDDQDDAEDTTRRDRVESQEDARRRKIQERVDKVKRELPPKIERLLARKPSKLRLRAQLALWRARYRLRRLEMQDRGGKLDFIAQVNPTIDLAAGWTFEERDVFRVLDEVATEYIATAEPAQGNGAAAPGADAEPLEFASPASALVALESNKKTPGWNDGVRAIGGFLAPARNAGSLVGMGRDCRRKRVQRAQVSRAQKRARRGRGWRGLHQALAQRADSRSPGRAEISRRGAVRAVVRQGAES